MFKKEKDGPKDLKTEKQNHSSNVTSFNFSGQGDFIISVRICDMQPGYFFYFSWQSTIFINPNDTKI